MKRRLRQPLKLSLQLRVNSPQQQLPMTPSILRSPGCARSKSRKSVHFSDAQTTPDLADPADTGLFCTYTKSPSSIPQTRTTRHSASPGRAFFKTADVPRRRSLVPPAASKQLQGQRTGPFQFAFRDAAFYAKLNKFYSQNSSPADSEYECGTYSFSLCPASSRYSLG